MEPIIQVAGIRDTKEQQWLYKAGVRWFGYPFFISPHQPDNHLNQLKEMIRTLPSDAFAVWIHYLAYADAIIPIVDSFQCEAIQCHGTIPTAELKKIKQERPDLIIIKSIVVGDGSTEQYIEQMQQDESFVDYFITDTYDASTGASGATGKTHDWNISKAIIEQSQRPVIIAGGLHPENVKEAIVTLNPAGVDAHTGLEDTNGYKCPKKVKSFMRASQSAFQSCG